MLLPIFFFSKNALRPLNTYSFITGRVEDFSYGTYQKKKSRGGKVTRYGFKIRLEGEIHIFNLNDLTKKEAERLKNELSTRPFVFIYYDKVFLTKTGTQVLVYDIVIGKWSLERTYQRKLLYFCVVGLTFFMVCLASYRLFKDYQYLKTDVKN
jgi:hypothetical protein